MKLTRGKVLELNHVLANTNFEMPISARFRYTVSQNIKITKEEIDAINEAFQAPEEVNEYTSARQKIIADAGISTDEEYKSLEEEYNSLKILMNILLLFPNWNSVHQQCHMPQLSDQSFRYVLQRKDQFLPYLLP